MTEVQERLIEQELGMVSQDDTGIGGTGNSAALDAICRSVGDLVGVARWPLRRMTVQVSCARVELEWAEPQSVLATGVVPTSSTVTVAPIEPTPTGHRVCAPLVGTFYRAPEPGAPPFVQVGDLVEPGQQVGIVEAMKLMNPVEADVAGRVVDVLVGDAEPIEYGQPLVLVEPTESLSGGEP